MMSLLYILLALVVLGGAVASLVFRSMVRAALALGLASAALAMIFFMLEAPYAGGFELSVGAGLVSVLFIVGISLTQTAEHADGA